MKNHLQKIWESYYYNVLYSTVHNSFEMQMWYQIYATNEESMKRIYGYVVSFKWGGETTVIYLHVTLRVTNHLSQDAFLPLCQSP